MYNLQHKSEITIVIHPSFQCVTLSFYKERSFKAQVYGTASCSDNSPAFVW